MKTKRFKLIPAVHLILQKGKWVLLSRRFNTGWEDGKYSLVSGHFNGNETATDAMIREAKEEVGIDIKAQDLSLVHAMHRLSDSERIDFFFLVEKWKGKIQNMEKDKCDDLKWCSVDHLPHNTIPYIRHALKGYRQNKYYSQFGWKQ